MCAFEFGNDDNPGTADPMSFAEYRAEWEERGRPVFSASGVALANASHEEAEGPASQQRA